MSEDLEAIARNIPSMGGASIGAFLRSAARHAVPGSSIVEVGTWLGAGTAHLALGVRDRNDRSVDIHCFDAWSASNDERAEAMAQKSIALAPFEDTLPRVRATLSVFQVPIHFHQGEIKKATWAGGPISVYVDDAAKGPEAFLHVLKTFAPHWIPGKTVIVLMDYYYWKKVGGWRTAEYRCQQSFIENYPEHFSVISDFRKQHDVPFSNEAFLYEKALDLSALQQERFPRSFRRLVAAPVSAIARRVLSRIGLNLYEWTA